MVVVIGAGYAGRMAVARLRRAGVDVTLVDPLARAVERTRLHEAAAWDRDVGWDVEAFAHRAGAAHVRDRAVGFPSGGVALASGRVLEADAVVVAAGSVPDDRGVPGVREHAVALGTPRDARVLYGDAAAGRRIAVVGAGLTGIELATELAEAHPSASVTLIGPDDGLSARGAGILRDRLAALGVQRDVRRVDRVHAGGLSFDDGTSLDADRVAWTAGMRAPDWLAAAGLPTDGAGRVRVQPSLEVVGRPGLVAAGDCASTGLAMACATAVPSACHAADTVLRRLRGEAPRPFRFGWVARCVSLGRQGALLQGVSASGAPTWAFGGMGAVSAKEWILRAAVGLADWEVDSGVPLYGWRQAQEIPA